jgi:hypothetical protein
MNVQAAIESMHARSGFLPEIEDVSGQTLYRYVDAVEAFVYRRHCVKPHLSIKSSLREAP